MLVFAISVAVDFSIQLRALTGESSNEIGYASRVRFGQRFENVWYRTEMTVIIEIKKSDDFRDPLGRNGNMVEMRLDGESSILKFARVNMLCNLNLVENTYDVLIDPVSYHNNFRRVVVEGLSVL